MSHVVRKQIFGLCFLILPIVHRNVLIKIQIKIIPGLCGKWIQESFFFMALCYLNYLFIHCMLCARHTGEYIWKFLPLPLFCYPCGSHTGRISWGKFLFSLSGKKFHLWKYFFLLSFVRKWKVCNNMFSALAARKFSQIVVITLSWESGNIALTASFIWFLLFLSLSDLFYIF